jgi:hypothetical protein|tara:strand:+ start:1447 stop:1803 length:357 start_codon:yes stop_codon:yes gene_type:complete
MNRIEEKQNELKKWIKKLGMTRKYFAEQYFIEEYDSLNEEEINDFYEKFRGHLKRSTTPVETIEIYLNYLFEMEEFKKKYYIKPYYIEDNILSKKFVERMKKISSDITDKLIEKEEME